MGFVKENDKCQPNKSSSSVKQVRRSIDYLNKEKQISRFFYYIVSEEFTIALT